MRISSKGRYGLAAMVYMGQVYPGGDSVAIITIAEKLGISKIYLEQVFSLLKRAGIVTSTKGAQGGYQLAREPQRITVEEVLAAAEASLLEKATPSVTEKSPEIEAAMENLVWNQIDQTLSKVLGTVTLADVVLEAEKYKSSGTVMFYI